MKRNLLLTAFISLFHLISLAQSQNADAIASQANNPLASIKSISIHNVYTSSVSGTDGSLNTAWVRYSQPFGKILVRASMPINSINLGGRDKSGLGDFNVFGTYILTPLSSTKQFGVGPILTIPTATSSLLGAGKWQIGVAVAAYIATNPTLQCGLLATWQHSFAGSSNRRAAHMTTIQPFFMWQLGKGIYLRSTAINVLDFENGNYLIPIGLGIGKIVKVNKIVFNLFAEPQFSIWHRGENMPEVQYFIGINSQF